MQICYLADNARFRIVGKDGEYRKLPKGRFVELNRSSEAKKIISLPRGIRTEVEPVRIG